MCKGPHHLEIEIHPQLVHGMIGILSLDVEGLLSSQPFWNLEEFVHLGHWDLFTLQVFHLVYIVKTEDIDDLVLFVFQGQVYSFYKGNNIVEFCYSKIRLQFPHNFVNLLNLHVFNDPQPCLRLPQLGTCVLNELGEERLTKWGAHCTFKQTP